MSEGPLPDRQPCLDNRGLRVATVPNWTEVSLELPCPRCGAPRGCETSQDGRFVRCRLVVSPHPIADGGWLHPIPPGPA